MEIAFYHDTNRLRSDRIASALHAGANKANVPFRIVREGSDAEHSAAIMYGASPRNLTRLENYRVENKPTALLDLGYWDRGHFSNQRGTYRVTINGLEESEYILHGGNDSTRYAQRPSPITLRPMQRRQIQTVLLAGMGPKAARLYGFAPEEWERQAVVEIQRRLPEATIIYRPKPSWADYSQLPGAILGRKELPLAHDLNRADCLVTHHSTAALDAVFMGIPAFTFSHCPAWLLTAHDWERLDCPYYPDFELVQRAAHNIAWCQWQQCEFASIAFWRWLLKRFGDSQ